MSTETPRIAVLVTLDSKFDVALNVCNTLRAVGADPWIIDLSLRPHTHKLTTFPCSCPLDQRALSPDDLREKSRADASQIMLEAGRTLLKRSLEEGSLAAAIGVGGANGSTMACGIMRGLPILVPKVMVTPVAATAAVEWYVAQSDIAMFPTIGDVSLNRITKAVILNASHAIAAMGRSYLDQRREMQPTRPLFGISTFGNLQVTVDRLTHGLEKSDAEVIHFHASGPGGKALESLARAGALQGVIDLTTSELADYLTGGVYSAGDSRLVAAARMGIPQVVVPGGLDFTNWWVGRVPEKYHGREFYQYNQEIILMRTNQAEFSALGKLFGERLSNATGPFRVLIPKRGFSQMTQFETQDLAGKSIGRWHQPDCDQAFTTALKHGLPAECVCELDMHINDPEFSEEVLSTFQSLVSELT